MESLIALTDIGCEPIEIGFNIINNVVKSATGYYCRVKSNNFDIVYRITKNDYERFKLWQTNRKKAK